jgi:hypothetical protein
MLATLLEHVVNTPGIQRLTIFSTCSSWPRVKSIGEYTDEIATVRMSLGLVCLSDRFAHFRFDLIAYCCYLRLVNLYFSCLFGQGKVCTWLTFEISDPSICNPPSAK